MNFDLEEMIRRLKDRAEAIAATGEVVKVTVGVRSDLPAWECRVKWTAADGTSRETSFSGELARIEHELTVQIDVLRRQRADDPR